MQNRTSVFNKKSSRIKMTACPKKSTDDPREESLNEGSKEEPITRDP